MTGVLWRHRLVVLLAGLVLIGPSACNDGRRRAAQERTTTTSAQTIDVGRLGELPAPASVDGPKLRTPTTVIEVPGVFPLGGTVAFSIPIRNDGNALLVIDKMKPG